MKLAGIAVTDCRVVGATIGKVAFGKKLYVFGTLPVKYVLFILFLQQLFTEHFLCARYGSVHCKLIPVFRQTKISVLMELAFSGSGTGVRVGTEERHNEEYLEELVSKCSRLRICLCIYFLSPL